eukprot:7352983-Lingulodinium_polyedra.AAC.1
MYSDRAAYAGDRRHISVCSLRVRRGLIAISERLTRGRMHSDRAGAAPRRAESEIAHMHGTVAKPGAQAVGFVRRVRGQGGRLGISRGHAFHSSSGRVDVRRGAS